MRGDFTESLPVVDVQRLLLLLMLQDYQSNCFQHASKHVVAGETSV
jgi:hypothetical protein